MLLLKYGFYGLVEGHVMRASSSNRWKHLIQPPDGRIRMLPNKLNSGARGKFKKLILSKLRIFLWNVWLHFADGSFFRCKLTDLLAGMQILWLPMTCADVLTQVLVQAVPFSRVGAISSFLWQRFQIFIHQHYDQSAHFQEKPCIWSLFKDS